MIGEELAPENSVGNIQLIIQLYLFVSPLPHLMVNS